MLGSLILYLKGMRIMMFQLSGYYYKVIPTRNQYGAYGYGDQTSRLGPNV